MQTVATLGDLFTIGSISPMNLVVHSRTSGWSMLYFMNATGMPARSASSAFASATHLGTPWPVR